MDETIPSQVLQKLYNDPLTYFSTPFSHLQPHNSPENDCLFAKQAAVVFRPRENDTRKRDREMNKNEEREPVVKY